RRRWNGNPLICLSKNFGALRPVNLVACPVALCGSPSTPRRASVSNNRTPSPCRPTAAIVKDLPLNKSLSEGVGNAAHGLYAAASPNPTPSMNSNKTDMGPSLSDTRYLLSFYFTTNCCQKWKGTNVKVCYNNEKNRCFTSEESPLMRYSDMNEIELVKETERLRREAKRKVNEGKFHE